MLKAEGLTKSLGHFMLKDISFCLEPGYIMGVIGVNGSGKTTLIKCLLNLYERDAGSIKLCNLDIAEEKEWKDRIGFVLDENMFEGELSIRENAKVYGRLYSQFEPELFQEYCKAFEIPLKKRLKKLSVGMQMRFQIAFALSHHAKLLLMDEPTAGLDPMFRRELLNIMQDVVAEEKCSVLFSTHLTEDLDRVGDYILLLHEGCSVFYLSKEELQDRYLILQGGEEDIWRMPSDNVVYKDYGENFAAAMIRRRADWTETDISDKFQVKTPMIEEIMYYLEKGDYRNA